MIKLVVDMMGGDLGSEETTKGVLNFLKKHDDVIFYCVGKQEELKELNNNKNIVVINASEVLPMETSAMDALRAKSTSMYVAIEEVTKEEADAIVSCGSTAGYLSLSTLKLKRIKGIIRPAFVAPFPTKIKGKQVVILDIGASTVNTSDELVQFALMGQLYSETVLDNKNPNVYLLSNGTEEGKGTDAVKEAHQKLKEVNPHFKGNIEGRDVLYGEADVVVCDGYSGNILLKTAEGVAKIMSGMIKSAFKRSFASKLGYLLSKKGFDEMSKTMDYKSTGGAMLLGVNNVVVKAHGNSDAYSFECALEVAYKLSKNQLVNKIKEGLNNV